MTSFFFTIFSSLSNTERVIDETDGNKCAIMEALDKMIDAIKLTKQTLGKHDRYRISSQEFRHVLKIEREQKIEDTLDLVITLSDLEDYKTKGFQVSFAQGENSITASIEDHFLVLTAPSGEMTRHIKFNAKHEYTDLHGPCWNPW